MTGVPALQVTIVEGGAISSVLHGGLEVKTGLPYTGMVTTVTMGVGDTSGTTVTAEYSGGPAGTMVRVLTTAVGTGTAYVGAPVGTPEVMSVTSNEKLCIQLTLTIGRRQRRSRGWQALGLGEDNGGTRSEAFSQSLDEHIGDCCLALMARFSTDQGSATRSEALNQSRGHQFCDSTFTGAGGGGLCVVGWD